MKAARTFIALNVPCRNRFPEVLEKLEECGVRTVGPDRLHLTLVFLGDVDTDRLENVRRATERATDGTETSEVRICGLGSFPNMKDPRVLWAGVQTDLDLAGLTERIRSELRKERIRFDTKQFAPHITLARLKHGTQIEKVTADYGETEFTRFVPLTVDIVLSELRPEGPKYTVYGSVPLRKCNMN